MAFTLAGVVYGELASVFPSRLLLDESLADMGIRFVAMNEAACYSAGDIFKSYRQRGGSRNRVLADFLIAAHAAEFANAFFTRDGGFYRRYFPKLDIRQPVGT